MAKINERSTVIEGRLCELKEDNKKALLVGIYLSSPEKNKCLEHLDELQSLGDTFGLETIKQISVHVRKFDTATFIGKGKVEEIQSFCEENNVNIVVFDDEISPHQQRNLEKIFKIPVIDRTELILGVFAQRARTKEAKIQVELALFQYQLPRLKRMWTHLSRQKTGGGGKGGYLKGEGETQIEIDRRILKKKISQLNKELKEIIQQREVQRKARLRSNIPTFAIIGYTNAGKSTLFNALTDANIFVEDKLFATLDTTTRKYILPNNQEILLIDTVGLIRKIPHNLVAAFRSTLEEATQADILIHLIDVSDHQAVDHAKATFAVLKELNAEKRPMITCLNKIDALTDKNVILELKMKYPKTIEISALEKKGFLDLLDAMIKEISLLRKIVHLRIPQSRYDLVSELMKEGRVISCDYEENDILLVVEIPSILEKKVLEFSET